MYKYIYILHSYNATPSSQRRFHRRHQSFFFRHGDSTSQSLGRMQDEGEHRNRMHPVAGFHGCIATAQEPADMTFRHTLRARSGETHAALHQHQWRATGNDSRPMAIPAARLKSDSHQKYNRCDARLKIKNCLATVNPASVRATHCVLFSSIVLKSLFSTFWQVSQIPVFLYMLSPASVWWWFSVLLHATQRSSSCAVSTSKARLYTRKSDVSKRPSMMNTPVFAMAAPQWRTGESHHCCDNAMQWRIRT